MKISTIYFPDEEEFSKIKELAYKERKTVSEIARISLEEYYKKHADGNPTYTLEQFTDENFLATPAYHRPRETWLNYLLKCSDKEWKEWTSQLQMFLSLEREVIDRR